jgi:AcrR family transcriptional regulator
MARPRPAHRFTALITAAADAFIAYGYERTQMQDVADTLGVAKGTLYGYVESKMALFGAALRYADGLEPAPGPDRFPLPPPAEGELAALLTGRLATEVDELRLNRALIDRRDSPVGDEFTDIVTDLYRRLTRHRVAIKLVDRCGPELPDLGEIWFGSGRWAQVAALTDYLTSRAAQGGLTLPGPVPVVARTILETCTLWAVHLHWDPDPPPTGARPDDDTVATTLAALLTRGLVSATELPRPAASPRRT